MQRVIVSAAGSQGLAGLAQPVRDWAAAEAGRFALWLPVLMSAGVVAYFSLPAEPPVWLGAACFAAFSACGWLAGPRPWLRGPCVAAAALALGFAACQFATWRAPPLAEVPSRATIVTGTVSAVEQLPGGRRITLDRPVLDGNPVLPRAVRLRLRAGDEIPVAAGDTLRVRALLMRPAPPAWPGAWDLQRDAFYARVGAFGYALNPAERVAETAPSGPAHGLQLLRERIVARIAAVLPGTQGAIAATLLTGGTASIPEADRAAFRDSGLAHLLAIAGLHIAIVMGLAFGTVRLGLALSEYAALHWPVKQIAALAAIAAGGAYMMLTGAHVPIIRSFAMACLVTLGVLSGRKAVSLRGLALAMATLVLMAPNEVMGVSFQMSFSAVLALIAGYAALRPWLTRLNGAGGWRRLRGHVVALALTSALAGTASAPYGAYHFGHIQLYYVFANMAAVPLTSLFVMPAAMAALLLMPVHLEALALVPMGWGIEAVLWVGRIVSAWPAAVLATPHMPPWGLAVLSVGIAWTGLWRTRLRHLGWAAIVLGAASPAFDRPPDILVSADARLIGVRDAGRVFIRRSSGASAFTRDSWLQLWAVREATALGEATKNIACDEAGCLVHGRGTDARVISGEGACDAAVLVTTEPLRLHCPGAAVVDRFSVWRQGAHAIWLDPGGPVLMSDRQFRGARPWVLPLPTRTTTPPGLKPAQTEELAPE
jgi:competence protein ComEC